MTFCERSVDGDRRVGDLRCHTSEPRPTGSAPGPLACQRAQNSTSVHRRPPSSRRSPQTRMPASRGARHLCRGAVVRTTRWHSQRTALIASSRATSRRRRRRRARRGGRRARRGDRGARRRGVRRLLRADRAGRHVRLDLGLHASVRARPVGARAVGRATASLLAPDGALLTCIFPIAPARWWPLHALDFDLVRGLLEPVGLRAVEVRDPMPPEAAHAPGGVAGSGFGTALAVWRR